MRNRDCPFCSVAEDRIIEARKTALAIADGYPVSEGHMLIVSRRHISSWFDATPAERADILYLIDSMKSELDERHGPDGYNIGINDGAAAGQTIDHLHIHLIPRYEGDVQDPRGGVRYVIPEKAPYWED
jgi:diadenosine tetraphosphate (Ap4A) HIT family hydrolase